jgi:hypothetical protein
MKKTVLTFGLISGAIMSVMMALTIPFHDAVGLDAAEVIGYTSIVAASLLIFFGVRSYRDNIAGGSVRFGRAFAVGALIALVASLLYVATWEVIYFSSGSDFVARYQAHEIEKSRASGASQAEIDKKIAEMQRFAELYKNPAINAAITLIEPLPIGLVIALIAAGILSRRRRGEPGVQRAALTS